MNARQCIQGRRYIQALTPNEQQNNVPVNNGTVKDWQLTKNNAMERIQYIYTTNTFSDCKFIVSNGNEAVTFKAHKMWLSMASPVFEAMFRNEAPEETTVTIEDVYPNIFKDLLKYIYTDAVDLQSFDQARDLCYAAKKYMLPHLFEVSVKYLWGVNNPAYLCEACDFGKLVDSPTLMEKSLELICRNSSEVFLTEGFLSTSGDTLMAILDAENMNIKSELDLFYALEKYSKHKDLKMENMSTRQLAVKNALKKVRFLSLFPAEFAQISETNLLTPEEKLSIFTRISLPNSEYPMPDGFSLNRQRRKYNMINYGSKGPLRRF